MLHLVLLLLAVTSTAANTAAKNESFDIESPLDVSFQGMGFKQPLVEFPECHMQNSSTKCSIDELRARNESKAYYVVPEGDTKDAVRCLNGDPYRFQVFPGSSKKLLVYAQEGGGCFDYLSHRTQSCRQAPGMTPECASGIFHRSSTRNPYHDYTIIQILYCTGDLMTGDAQMDFEIDGKPVIQNGAQATRMVFDYIKAEQFDLEDVVIMGTSAGSLAMQAYANYLFSSRIFKYKYGALIMDSFVDLAPAKAGNLLKTTGNCENEMIFDGRPKLLKKCRQGRVSMHQLLIDSMRKFPNVDFVTVTGKEDTVQRLFHSGLSKRSFLAYFTNKSNTYYTQMAMQLAADSKQFDNAFTYMVNMDYHAFVPKRTFFYTYPNGVFYKALQHKGVGMVLPEWLAQFPRHNKEQIVNQCVRGYTEKKQQSFNVCPQGALGFDDEDIPKVVMLKKNVVLDVVRKTIRNIFKPKPN